MTRRVLIIEDEPLVAMDLEIILEEAGYEVVGIARAMDHALRIAASKHPDLAIMDVHLEDGSNGVETAKRLRQEFNVPSLMVSAEVGQQTKAMALPWAPLGFIEKPYFTAQIVKALRDAHV
ncbi:MAG: response regulator [Methylobacterium mesophilicum]|nr:response regulator [Methylobacterium mesophilicum]